MYVGSRIADSCTYTSFVRSKILFFLILHIFIINKKLEEKSNEKTAKFSRRK